MHIAQKAAGIDNVSLGKKGAPGRGTQKLSAAQKLFNTKENQERVAAINQKKKEDQFFRFIFIGE